ncbi:response regulator [Cohnella hashimotonis]|uniref:Response regulator n=1 Tax=Cohnella hashimotonis TaxID=2826895 RepID=A0ABT6TNI6_9BACL|nr:response regulator [Cohnella hashimotonis]MDI4648320.1 response regulator [Cohnella hashimotonis]
MIRVIVVEDEKPTLELMTLLIGRHPMLELVGAYTSPFEALERFAETRPDAAFLDVEMPKMGGIALAEKLKAIDGELQVAFTTAYPAYAVEAFRVSAVDYLLKPVTPDDLARVALRFGRSQEIRSALKSAAPSGKAPAVRCLGTFETRGADGRPMSWPTRKTEELFAYLLAYPDRLHGKWQLADLLWPELDEERALHNLHNTVYRLKKSLKTAGVGIELAHGNQGYRFRAQAGLSDLQLLREYGGSEPDTVAVAREAHERVLMLVKGELFAGKDYAWSAGLAVEVASQQAALTRRFAAKLRKSAPSLAKSLMFAYLSESPLDEEVNEELLELLAELGESALFHRHYTQYAERLGAELDAEPSAALRKLAARMNG